MMKLSEYAAKHNVTYRTAYNHFKRGLIERAYQLPSGCIVIPDSYVQPTRQDYVVTYARVSSSENKSNLATQSKMLIDFCNASGWTTRENIREVGSGLNDNRKGLMKILTNGLATKLVVEHKDRLTRFGFNYILELCKKNGIELVVVNNVEDEKEDIVQDFVSIITCFCAKIYGQRRSKRKTEQIIQKLENEEA